MFALFLFFVTAPGFGATAVEEVDDLWESYEECCRRVTTGTIESGNFVFFIIEAPLLLGPELSPDGNLAMGKLIMKYLNRFAPALTEFRGLKVQVIEDHEVGVSHRYVVAIRKSIINQFLSTALTDPLS